MYVYVNMYMYLYMYVYMYTTVLMYSVFTIFTERELRILLKNKMCTIEFIPFRPLHCVMSLHMQLWLY